MITIYLGEIVGSKSQKDKIFNPQPIFIVCKIAFYEK